MTLEEFSGGYYSLDVQVQPYDEGPVIESGVYDFISKRIYSDTDAPITMKLSMDNGEYFTVGAEHSVPPSVLALPRPWVKNFDVDEDGRPTRVFVLKPEHAYLLNQATWEDS